MTQIGKVVAIQSNKATIRVIRKGACGDNCSMCGACGGQSVDIIALCEINVCEGDRVLITSDGTAIVGGLMCLFILPIIMPLGAYLCLSQLVSHTVGLVGSVVGLALSLSVIVALAKSKKYLLKAQAKVVRTL